MSTSPTGTAIAAGGKRERSPSTTAFCPEPEPKKRNLGEASYPADRRHVAEQYSLDFTKVVNDLNLITPYILPNIPLLVSIRSPVHPATTELNSWRLAYPNQPYAAALRSRTDDRGVARASVLAEARGILGLPKWPLDEAIPTVLLDPPEGAAAVEKILVRVDQWPEHPLIGRVAAAARISEMVGGKPDERRTALAEALAVEGRRRPCYRFDGGRRGGGRGFSRGRGRRGGRGGRGWRPSFPPWEAGPPWDVSDLRSRLAGARPIENYEPVNKGPLPPGGYLSCVLEREAKEPTTAAREWKRQLRRRRDAAYPLPTGPAHIQPEFWFEPTDEGCASCGSNDCGPLWESLDLDNLPPGLGLDSADSFCA